jgi:hypothetical protein
LWQHDDLKSILCPLRKLEKREMMWKEAVVAYFKAVPSPGSGILPKLAIDQPVKSIPRSLQSAIGSYPVPRNESYTYRLL